MDAFESQSTPNFHQITPVVQTHLKKVYDLLILAQFVLYFGAYLHLRWNMGGLLTTIGCIGTLLWLLFKPQYPMHKKYLLLMAFVLFEGASFIPVIKLAVEVDQNILIIALHGIMLPSWCFSISVLLAQRREYLYLGGLLSSVVFILTYLEILSFIFGGPISIFKFKLFFGLLVFVGYMMVVIQVIIEKAQLGDMDYVQHTHMFFFFVQILVIMLKNLLAKEEEKKDELFTDCVHSKKERKVGRGI